MAEVFDTLLLLALPASGKSEVRTYLNARDPEGFHMGPNVQLDDYPYVHMQLRVDDELEAMGEPRAFHHPGGEERNGPFFDSREIAGLCHLLNEDYLAIRAGQADNPENATLRLFERFDAASEAVGARPKFKDMDPAVIDELVKRLEPESREVFDDLAKIIPDSLEGKTIVIEFARGGPPEGEPPFPPGFGYKAALAQLSPELLRRAAILYIWVSPEESRRKNRARARPGEDGSILFHGTPEQVMLAEYSQDDMAWLVEGSDVPNTVPAETPEGIIHVPVARFDNREDLTTFLRNDQADWKEDEINKIHTEIVRSCGVLWETYAKLR